MKYLLVGKNMLTDKQKRLLRTIGIDADADLVEWINEVGDVREVYEKADKHGVDTIVITSLPDWMIAAMTVISGKRKKKGKPEGSRLLYFRQKMIGVYDDRERAEEIKREEDADILFESSSDYVVMKTIGIDRLVRAKIISVREV